MMQPTGGPVWHCVGVAAPLLCRVYTCQHTESSPHRDDDDRPPDMPVDPNEPTYCLCHQVCCTLLLKYIRAIHHLSVNFVCLSLPVYLLPSFSLLFHLAKLPRCSLFSRFPTMLLFRMPTLMAQVSYGDMVCCDNSEVSTFMSTRYTPCEVSSCSRTVSHRVVSLRMRQLEGEAQRKMVTHARLPAVTYLLSPVTCLCLPRGAASLYCGCA